jgi:hypothetical protein
MAIVDDAHDSQALMSRVLWKDGRPRYGMYQRHWDEEAQESRFSGTQAHTAAKSGRLRLVRAGAKLRFGAAEGNNPEFAVLHELPFTDAALRGVRVVCSTGGRDSSLDVRLTDLHIRAASLPGVPRPDMAEPVRERGWLAAASLIALAAAVPFAATAAVALLRRRKTPAPNLTGPHAKADAALARFQLTCAGCGQKLKAKAELVGKKVKCPVCGDAIRVAAAGAEVGGND